MWEGVAGNVFRIAICDDSDIDRELLADLLDLYCKEHAIEYTCMKYRSGEALYYELGDGGWFDIILLDIYMQSSLGIDVARKLREIAYRGIIIFYTETIDFAPESFEVGASGYQLKPYDYNQLSRMMDRIIPMLDDNTYPVKNRSTIIRVPRSEIMYVESKNSHCILHQMGGKSYTIYKKLGEIEKDLSAPCFLRCHQSYLVNMNFVQEIDTDFVMKNGDVVLIRKRNQKEIRQSYFDYCNGPDANAYKPTRA